MWRTFRNLENSCPWHRLMTSSRQEKKYPFVGSSTTSIRNLTLKYWNSQHRLSNQFCYQSIHFRFWNFGRFIVQTHIFLGNELVGHPSLALPLKSSILIRTIIQGSLTMKPHWSSGVKMKHNTSLPTCDQITRS